VFTPSPHQKAQGIPDERPEKQEPYPGRAAAPLPDGIEDKDPAGVCLGVREFRPCAPLMKGTHRCLHNDGMRGADAVQKLVVVPDAALVERFIEWMLKEKRPIRQ